MDFDKLSTAELRELAAKKREAQSPDYNNMSLDELRALAAKKQEDTPSDYKRYAAQLGRNLAAGAADMADLPFVVAEGARWGAQKLARKLGADVEDPTFGEYLPNIGEKVAQGIDKVTGGYTAPRTKGEKIAEAATRGLAGLPAGLGVAGTIAKYAPHLQKTAKVIKTMSAPTAGNIGATAGSAAGSQAYLNDNPDSIGGGLLAGLVGGIAGQKGAGFAHNVRHHGLNMTAANRTGKMLGISPQKAQALGDLPVSVGDLSNSKFIQGIQHKFGWSPFATETMNKFYETQGKALRKSLGRGELPIDEEQAGALVRKSADKLAENRRNESSALAQKFEAPLVGDKALIDAENALGFNRERANQYVTQTGKNLYGRTAAAKESSHLQRIADEIAASSKSNSKVKIGKDYLDLDAPANKALKKAVESNVEGLSSHKGKVPYAELQLVKRNIDDAVSTYGKMGNLSQRELKTLRGSIKKDLDNHFSSLGGEANDAWHTFNQKEHLFQKNVKPNINQVFDASEKSFTAAFLDTLTSATSRGASPRKLHVIYEGLSPENKSKLFEASVNEIGKTPNGWSAVKARTTWNKMRPIQQNVFLEGLPTDQARADFRKTMKAIDAINEKSAALNTSGTAHHAEINQSMDLMKKGAKIVGSLGTGRLVGVDPSTVISGLLAPYVGARLFTNQKLLRWASQGMQAKNERDLVRHLNKIPEVKGLPQVVIAEAKSLGREIGQRSESDRSKRLRITIRPRKDQ